MDDIIPSDIPLSKHYVFSIKTYRHASAFTVYKISNTVNEMLYIGITKLKLIERWRVHVADAATQNTHLYKDMRLYGTDKYAIEKIEECPDKDTMRQREIYWIRALSTVYPQGYNMISPLTNAEAAIVKYNAWKWTIQQYANFFGLTPRTIQSIRADPPGSYKHVTKAHLPRSIHDFLD